MYIFIYELVRYFKKIDIHASFENGPIQSADWRALTVICLPGYTPTADDDYASEPLSTHCAVMIHWYTIVAICTQHVVRGYKNSLDQEWILCASNRSGDEFMGYNQALDMHLEVIRETSNHNDQ